MLSISTLKSIIFYINFKIIIYINFVLVLILLLVLKFELSLAFAPCQGGWISKFVTNFERLRGSPAL